MVNRSTKTLSNAYPDHQSADADADADATSETNYVAMSQTNATTNSTENLWFGDGNLTANEVEILRKLLARAGNSSSGGDGTEHNNNNNIDRTQSNLTGITSVDSEYPEFMESTHAWAIFADDTKKRATKMDRLVGTLIIGFQLFTYWMFATEAIEDYEKGVVVVTTRHATCLASNEEPQDNFLCDAEFTNDFDAFIAFFMLGIFLGGDVLQAIRVVKNAPLNVSMIFAILAAIEVISAYISACIAISYNLYIGEVTDAVEVGVGLLFIRELSQRAYAGIRYKDTKQYKNFLTVLFILVSVGMFMDPFCEYLFAVKE